MAVGATLFLSVVHPQVFFAKAMRSVFMRKLQDLQGLPSNAIIAIIVIYCLCYFTFVMIS